MTKTFESEVVDTIILMLEEKLRATGKHLIKTDTIVKRCQGHLPLADEDPSGERLKDIGIKQIIQGRLYAHNYFSVESGYFVNVVECDNLVYLKMIIDSKDDTIAGKIEARNRLKELKDLDGSLLLVPDENNIITLVETKTKEEIIADLEADAI